MNTFTLKSIFIFCCILATTTVFAQKFDVDTLQYKGSSNQYINLVILSDGYTDAQLPTFITDATKFTNYFFSVSPYSMYKNYFNVFIIKVPSLESGVKHPRTASDCPSATVHPQSNPNNYFGSTFDAYSIHRLVVPMNSTTLYNVLSNNFPNYDQVVVLANSTQYGGSGGTFATSTLHTSSGEVAVHEIGHSFAALADEYWAGSQYATEKANMTSNNNSSTIKWKLWLNAGTGIGINQHSGQTWYKPTSNACKMEVLNKPFCSVCTETTIEKIHSLVNPVTTISPSNLKPTVTDSLYFALGLMKPTPNTLTTTWTLNGTTIKNNVDSVLIHTTSFQNGTNTLSVKITDTTTLSKSTTHATSHLYTTTWTIDYTSTGMQAIQTNSNQIELTVYPNPATNLLNIGITAESPEIVDIRIFSSDGKLIQQVKNQKTLVGNIFNQIDISNYKTGIYFIEFKSETFTQVERFVKQ